MTFVAVWNADNMLGDEICQALSSQNNCYKLSDQVEMELLRNSLQERNIFVFICDFSSGSMFSGSSFIDSVCFKFRQMFEVTSQICQLLEQEKKKGDIIYITVDSGLKFPIGLICDDALSSYLESLSEDFAAGVVEVKGIYIKTFSRFLEKKRSSKKSKHHSQTIYRFEDLITYLKEAAFKDERLILEKVYYLGVSISSDVSQASL